MKSMWKLAFAIYLGMSLPAAVRAETSPAATAAPSPDAIADAVLAQQKDNRLFKVLLTHIPTFESEMRARIKTVVTTTPSYMWYDEGAVQGHALVEHYYGIYMPLASDASILTLMNYDISNLDHYKDAPELCVGYYVGSPAFMHQATPEYIAMVTNMKADIFESAFDHPVHRDLLPIAEARQRIVKAYETNGFDIRDAQYLTAPTTFPAADACRAIIEFNKAIQSLGPKDAPLVIASLTAFVAQSQNQMATTPSTP